MIEVFENFFVTASHMTSLFIRIIILCFFIYIIELTIKFLKKAIRYFDTRTEYLEIQINNEKHKTESTDKE